MSALGHINLFSIDSGLLSSNFLLLICFTLCVIKDLEWYQMWLKLPRRKIQQNVLNGLVQRYSYSELENQCGKSEEYHSWGKWVARTTSRLPSQCLLVPLMCSLGVRHGAMGFTHTTDDLEQWFSVFLMLRFFNTVPHGVATPNHKTHFVATSQL